MRGGKCNGGINKTVKVPLILDYDQGYVETCIFVTIAPHASRLQIDIETSRLEMLALHLHRLPGSPLMSECH